jgi:predicted Zn-dependent protease with MMP-like domain
MDAVMDLDEFEHTMARAFQHLPALFKDKVENVELIVEEMPSASAAGSVHSDSRSLLGLYQGVPLTQRGTWYGMTPVLPDRITLYKQNIERGCRTDDEIRKRIYEVLCHEVGHYFGMNETQIRSAMKSWESE